MRAKLSTVSGSSADILNRVKEPSLGRALLERIRKGRRRAAIMEVCGTHTMALFSTGIRAALPEGLRVISGPGCPVCVTPANMIGKAIRLAQRPDTILFCFGDLMRVPGAGGTLESVRGRVKVMYSPWEALEMARKSPNDVIVLFGVGFETTIPLFAATILAAMEEGMDNIRFLSSFRLIPPALDALLSRGNSDIDGFLLPGHVSVITGSDAFRFIPERYGIPAAVAGFEALDILHGLYLILEMLERGEARVENAYSRFVSPAGNEKARRVMDAVFTVCDAEWRGIGTLPGSGVRLREEFNRYDAELLLEGDDSEPPERKGCICGEIIMGRMEPRECALYGSECTPSHPVGPCMVSSEGTCAAHFKYGRL